MGLGPGLAQLVSGDALLWPVGGPIKACALRACHNFVLATPKYTAFPSLLFGDSAGTASGPAPVTFLGPERSRSAVSFHSVGPLSFIPQGCLSCFLPWNSNGSDPGFPPPLPILSLPHLVSRFPGFAAPALRFAPRGIAVASAPFSPSLFPFAFILKLVLSSGSLLQAWPHRPCLGGGMSFQVPFPRGGPLPGSSHPWCLSGSLRRAMWGSRRGGVEGGGAPAARVGRAPCSQHCPLPAAGWGPGRQDSSESDALWHWESWFCPLPSTTSVASHSRLQTPTLPTTPDPRPQGRAPSGS